MKVDINQRRLDAFYKYEKGLTPEQRDIFLQTLMEKASNVMIREVIEELNIEVE